MGVRNTMPPFSGFVSTSTGHHSSNSHSRGDIQSLSLPKSANNNNNNIFIVQFGAALRISGQ
jgi:hypothetical protein